MNSWSQVGCLGPSTIPFPHNLEHKLTTVCSTVCKARAICGSFCRLAASSRWQWEQLKYQVVWGRSCTVTSTQVPPTNNLPAAPTQSTSQGEFCSELRNAWEPTDTWLQQGTLCALSGHLLAESQQCIKPSAIPFARVMCTRQSYNFLNAKQTQGQLWTNTGTTGLETNMTFVYTLSHLCIWGK